MEIKAEYYLQSVPCSWLVTPGQIDLMYSIIVPCDMYPNKMDSFYFFVFKRKFSLKL